RARGAEVRTFEADVGRARDVAAVVGAVRATMPPLRGLVHAAAVLDDRTVLKLGRDEFARVLGPKLGGAALLHQATRGERLDFFVLYSSAAALLGSAGQGNYAAANACLDALAAYRSGEGLAATSVQWGPWAEVGLAAAQANRGERLAARGIGSMGPDEALGALERVVGSGAAVAGVVPLDVRQWLEMNPQLADAPFFGALAKAKAAPAGGGELARLLREASPEERRSRLERHVTEVVARVLRLDPARLEASVPFGSLGLDSLMGLEIRNRLEAGLALKLPATLLWTYPSVDAVTTFLGTRLAPPAPEAAAETEPPPAPPEPAGADIGVALLEQTVLSRDEADRLLAEELASLGAELTALEEP
ncbi:MAG TPA: beta-ketoacyl reductase, partial [Polyangiaceae bacterium]|nr:beta-ketoacyl reductase [Polyangiaceae bacterium]